jgi:four helix bundle protein
MDDGKLPNECRYPEAGEFQPTVEEAARAYGSPNLRERTLDFGVMIVRYCTSLPATDECRNVKNQMFRSGTSVGAHFREALRSRSTAEFISKIETALQELGETQYWLELLARSAIAPRCPIDQLHHEADQRLAILSSINIKQKRRL